MGDHEEKMPGIYPNHNKTASISSSTICGGESPSIAAAIALSRLESSVCALRRSGVRAKRLDPQRDTFSGDDPRIERDIVRMVAAFLEDAGYAASALTLREEASVRRSDASKNKARVRRLQDAVRAGEWSEADIILSKLSGAPAAKAIQLALHTQQYLELIERHETQRALVFLRKHLAPFATQLGARELADLSLLLTCASVQQARPDWPGEAASRDQLAKRCQALVFAAPLPSSSSFNTFGDERDEEPVPADRLVRLLQQAVAYQLEFSRVRPVPARPLVSTLLRDLGTLVVPNSLQSRLHAHASAVKCVSFVGDPGFLLATGGNDRTVRLWRSNMPLNNNDAQDDNDDSECDGTRKVEDNIDLQQQKSREKDDEIGYASQSGGRRQRLAHTLRGHEGRVWDVSAASSGQILGSASSDATVRIWSRLGDARAADEVDAPWRCTSILRGHEGDVYSCAMHPHGEHAVSAGYDRTARLYDVERQQTVLELHGHTAAVAAARFNPFGNLVATGSKDSSIKFWDLVSGVCVQTFNSHLGEVTAVQVNSNGTSLLSSSKDNSNRLWDVRMGRPVQRFRGHQNTSRSFVRSTFGPAQQLVLSGSEDGCLYIWDVHTGALLKRLRGHDGIVFDLSWHESQALLASCSDDASLITWTFDPDLPLVDEAFLPSVASQSQIALTSTEGDVDYAADDDQARHRSDAMLRLQ